MAVLLPPEKEKDPTDEELLFLFQKLSDQEKEIIRAQIRHWLREINNDIEGLMDEEGE